MNFGEWYKKEYGKKFDVSFECNDAEYEYHYASYCEQNNIEPDWTGRIIYDTTTMGYHRTDVPCDAWHL